MNTICDDAEVFLNRQAPGHCTVSVRVIYRKCEVQSSQYYKEPLVTLFENDEVRMLASAGGNYEHDGNAPVVFGEGMSNGFRC